ncbi:hypothetical protein [Mycobacterium intracellulare]|nr:hypothetical protein [Mycobacterium intracellulare]ASL11529.1 hypothetical protein MYCODSM44623_04847 [Mycobacterium intracellulare subsp. chimaera]ASL23479.1 hypothetical protein MYCOZU1_05108 [Mycobacterium intracellulare subsp. chimaera]ETZ27172.1 hypothetical protein L842_4760 [Mycobacterium intracellulare MIN_052511_1280]
MMYFSNGTAMNLKALHKTAKLGLAGCRMDGNRLVKLEWRRADD